ncbi:HlyD family secretion protein [Agarivorans sp. Alg241-V36]|uniref:HlyD family secretion protein n=1 Tax=Agarivorans sp. Alg241-V36 TaxID=2305992 RepID=UPI0013D6A9F1|nr:HlyD family efflux transporter periplasmic adaptor subunit [Agarivorans sp. Alg241-V36]
MADEKSKENGLLASSESLGEPLEITPLGSKAAIWLMCAIAVTVIILMFNADFKRKVTLVGMVNSVAGQFNVYPLKSGYVTQSWVTEQMEVAKGQRLFEVTAEVHTKSGDSIAELKNKILTSIESLKLEISRSTEIYNSEFRELNQLAVFLENQQQELDNQLQLQQDVANMLLGLVKGQRELVDKKFISASQMQTKEQEYARALTDLSELKYSKIAMLKERRSVAENLSSITLKHENDIARIEREISSYQQKLFELEIQNEKIVIAPENGVITALSINAGESVQSDTLAMVIIPLNVKWHVEVYATSTDVGFIRAGNPAKLRYAAYPYQRFGLYGGSVKHVSKAAIKGSSIDSRLPASEYFYKVTVELDEQCILAYGKCEPLQAGMGVTASIETERRTLIEWALDPLYTIKGKL